MNAEARPPANKTQQLRRTAALRPVILSDASDCGVVQRCILEFEFLLLLLSVDDTMVQQLEESADDADDVVLVFLRRRRQSSCDSNAILSLWVQRRLQNDNCIQK